LLGFVITLQTLGPFPLGRCQRPPRTDGLTDDQRAARKKDVRTDLGQVRGVTQGGDHCCHDERRPNTDHG